MAFGARSPDRDMTVRIVDASAIVTARRFTMHHPPRVFRGSNTLNPSVAAMAFGAAPSPIESESDARAFARRHSHRAPALVVHRGPRRAASHGGRGRRARRRHPRPQTGSRQPL